MIFYPPANLTSRDFTKPTIFLAGSIEMGKAENWQLSFAEKFDSIGFEVFNPRRSDWNPDWIQSFENPHFYQQVDWELNALEKSDYILMRFTKGTMSPISLLELGLYANTKKLVVICDDEFWRKGNVDMVCKRWNIPQFNNLESVVTYISKDIELPNVNY